MSIVRMYDDDWATLHNGFITVGCLQFIRSYKTKGLDLSKTAVRIQYKFDPMQSNTEVEKEMIQKLQDLEYEASDGGLDTIIWTMKDKH